MAKQIDLQKFSVKKVRPDCANKKWMLNECWTVIHVCPKHACRFQTVWLQKYKWLELHDVYTMQHMYIEQKCINPEGCKIFNTLPCFITRGKKFMSTNQLLNMQSNIVNAHKAATDWFDEVTSKLSEFVTQLRTWKMYMTIPGVYTTKIKYIEQKIYS